jgi:prepilin-type N-terminal cleavage/methylation domain-containing protein
MTLTTLIEKLRTRLADEAGFSLIELLTVCMILSILAMIAIPSYNGFEENAHSRTAELNVNSAIPVAVQYYTNNNDSYAGLTGAALKALAPGLGPGVEAGPFGAQQFCIQDTDGDVTYAYPGGNGGSNVLTPAICNSAYSVSP